uniref:Phage_integrase domain-containing protein n=1 Tax=Strongyloides papillosus TaxID=174720 RepID=A0A0N5B460_STREA
MREDNDHSLKNISMKLTTLLAISTGKRVSEICNIFLSNTKLDTDIVVRLPKTKNSEKNIPNHFLTIISYPEKALCPAATFYEYLDLTKDIRGKSDQLFIAYEGKKKGEPISKDRLSKWIRLYLEKANIFTNPHSIRSNMSSQCALSNIPIKTIIEVTLAKMILDHHKEH